MKDINEIKNRIRNKQVKNDNKFKKVFKKLVVVILIFLILGIIINKNPSLKRKIFNKVYNSNFSFAKIKKIYNEKIGNILPFQNTVKTKKVFSEKLTYKSISKYNKGVKLVVDDNYLVPAIKGGIVIFEGKKDGFNTIIVQDSSGVDIWYSNLKNINVKLYDYIDKNEIIGEVNDNTLYLKFKKDGVEIDSKEILK